MTTVRDAHSSKAPHTPAQPVPATDSLRKTQLTADSLAALPGAADSAVAPSSWTCSALPSQLPHISCPQSPFWPFKSYIETKNILCVTHKGLSESPALGRTNCCLWQWHKHCGGCSAVTWPWEALWFPFSHPPNPVQIIFSHDKDWERTKTKPKETRTPQQTVVHCFLLGNTEQPVKAERCCMHRAAAGGLSTKSPALQASVHNKVRGCVCLLWASGSTQDWRILPEGDRQAPSASAVRHP